MGESKAALTIAGESLLERTIKILTQVATPIVVAAAADQPLPALPEGMTIARDPEPAQGPLAAFTSALAVIPSDRPWVYLVGCDLPFLTAEFLRLLADYQTRGEAVVPYVDGLWHPLAAIYRREVRST